MIIDTLTAFCSATSFALNNSNQLLGNVVPTQVGSMNTLISQGGRPLFLVLRVALTAVGGTSVQFQLVSDSVAALNVSRTVHLDTGAIPVATLVAGYTRAWPMPPEATYEAFLGIWETTVGNVTAGKVDLSLTNDVR